MKLPALRSALAILLTVAAGPSSFGWFGWDDVEPGPVYGPGAGGPGGYWVFDPLTEGNEALKWSTEEAMIGVAKEREGLERDQNSVWKQIEDQLGPPVRGDLPEFRDIQWVDPVVWAHRQEAMNQLAGSRDADRYRAALMHMAFVDRQEKLMTVYQERQKHLEAVHRQELSWQNRVSLQARLGILSNQIVLEEIKLIEASTAARSEISQQKNDLLEERAARLKRDMRARGINP